MTTTMTNLPSTPAITLPIAPPIDSVGNQRRRAMTDMAPAVTAVLGDHDTNAHDQPHDRWRGAIARTSRSRRPRSERWLLNDPTQVLLTAWMDHLADGHSTTRMRSARRAAPRPI